MRIRSLFAVKTCNGNDAMQKRALALALPFAVSVGLASCRVRRETTTRGTVLRVGSVRYGPLLRRALPFRVTNSRKLCLAERKALFSTEPALPSKQSLTRSLDNAKNVTLSCRLRICRSHLLLSRLECQSRTNAVPRRCLLWRGLRYCPRTS